MDCKDLLNSLPKIDDELSLKFDKIGFQDGESLSNLSNYLDNIEFFIENDIIKTIELTKFCDILHSKFKLWWESINWDADKFCGIKEREIAANDIEDLLVSCIHSYYEEDLIIWLMITKNLINKIIVFINKFQPI